MTKFLAVDDGGYVWHIPLEVIAKNRADFYADDPDSSFDEEMAYVMEDDYEGPDWFVNNMNWSDVSAVAVLVKPPGQKTEPDISESDIELVECHD